MCGIVGYIGTGAVADILLNGLKNLEYRGYDSAGIALNDNHKISVYKAEGKLNNLYNIINNTNLSSNICQNFSSSPSAIIPICGKFILTTP